MSAAKQRKPKYQVILQDSLVALGPTKHSAKVLSEQESDSDVIYPLHSEENNETAVEHSVSVNIAMRILEDNANTLEGNAINTQEDIANTHDDHAMNTLEDNANTFEDNAINTLDDKTKLSPVDRNVIMSESDCECKCENEYIGDENVSNIGESHETAYSPAMGDVSCAKKLLSQTSQTQVENHSETICFIYTSIA